MTDDEQIGYVQQARWSEWEAVCAIDRCGWTHSQGNKTREDAEASLRSHASLSHRPRVPVYRASAIQQIKATALREAADAWQTGQWADAPRRPDRVQERMANAQYVSDWLRRRAEEESASS